MKCKIIVRTSPGIPEVGEPWRFQEGQDVFIRINDVGGICSLNLTDGSIWWHTFDICEIDILEPEGGCMNFVIKK